MRRAVEASLSISLRPITPRGSRSRFMEERLALPPPFFAAPLPPLLFSLSRHQEPLSTLTNYGRTPRRTFQERIFIKRLRHTHLPPMEFTNYFFINGRFHSRTTISSDDRSVRFSLVGTSMRQLDGGGSMCTRVVTRHRVPNVSGGSLIVQRIIV